MNLLFNARKSILQVLTVLLLIIVVSCRKDRSGTEEINPAQRAMIEGYLKGPRIQSISFDSFTRNVNLASLGHLKEVMLSSQKNAAENLRANAVADGGQPTYHVNVDSARLLVVDGQYNYIFSIAPLRPSSVTFRNLTITKRGTTVLAFLSTYTPTRRWARNHSLGKIENFEGRITHMAIDLKDQHLLEIGQLPSAGTSTNSTQQKRNTVVNSSGGIQTCVWVVVYEQLPYRCASGTHGPEDFCYLTGDDRAGYATVQTIKPECSDGGGGDGTGAGTTPTTPPGYQPCTTIGQGGNNENTPGENQVPGGEMDETNCDPQAPQCPAGSYWSSECNTCIGGTTGLTACPPKEIRIDTSARKCLDTLSKGIISNASIISAFQNIFTTSTNSNNVADMIGRISQSSDWNVGIREGNINNQTNYNGDTIETNAQTTAVQGMVFITFNKPYLNQATNLSVARTMIHELMHAYFVYGMAMTFDPGYSKFVEANDLLFKKNGNPFYDQNDAQHEQIAKKYVDQMSLLLEAYAISAGIQSPDPNISLFDYCKDLAWGGLSDTKAYRKYANNKTRIQNHLKSEAKRDVNSTKKKGC